MTSKADFTPEEWWRLSQAPLAVAMYVSGADPRTGPIGTIKELAAPFKLAKSQLNRTGVSSLLGELLMVWNEKLAADSKKADADPAADESIAPGSIDLVAFVAGVGKTLDAKASAADAQAVKAWLATAARASAEAGKEGAVLGIGGERVSGEESKAVAEIAQVLGVTA